MCVYAFCMIDTGFCKSPTHKFVVYCRAVYDASPLSALDVPVGAVYKIMLFFFFFIAELVVNLLALVINFAVFKNLCKNSCPKFKKSASDRW